MADVADDTDKIERDLAATRERMDRRLDELGDRLTPSQLVSDTLTQVTGGDGGQFVRMLIAKAKADPIPAVLAGVGIAWLMSSGRDEAGPTETDLPTRLRSAERGVVRMRDEHPDVHASRIDDARGQVLGLARSASDTASSYAERIREGVASATRHTRETRRAVEGASSVDHRWSRLIGDPVVLGAASVLAGLLAGALIPLSRREEHALGVAADGLRVQGRGLAQDVVDGGIRVAGDVIGAVKDSAAAHGLTADRPVGELLGDLQSGELVEHLRSAAREVGSVGLESVGSRMRDDEAVQEPARD